MNIEIISFTFSDSELIKYSFSIRQKVFVVEQKCPPEIEYENEEICIHYLAKYDNKYVATARYRHTTEGIKLERFAVIKEYRRLGIASIILNKILNDVFAFGKKIYLHSQVQAMTLYRNAGFEAVGDMFEEAGIQHYKMVFRKQIN